MEAETRIRAWRAATRSWPPLAAWGAGLIQLALGAGAITGEDAGARLPGILVAIVGTASLVWGGVRLGGRPATTAGMIVALSGIAATTAVLIAAPARTSVLAAAAAVMLAAVTGAVTGRERRVRRMRVADPPSASRAAVTGILIGALAVAGIVTPALGATEAGRLAPAHHLPAVDVPGHH